METTTRRCFIGTAAAAGLTVSLAGCDNEPAEAVEKGAKDPAACTTEGCVVDTTKTQTVKKPSILCTPASTLIFACSGAADTGEISDRAARQLTKQGKGKMFCLAGIGGNVKPLVEATQKAKTIVAIDGCAVGCVKQCLLRGSFIEFHHMIVTDQGLEKGKSPATDENIKKVIEKALKFFEA